MLSSNPSSLSNSENDTGIEPNNEVSLKASCGRINPDTKGLKNIPAPTVKLYLTGNSCASAVAGIMYQPRPDTLCTYQALVIALEQANATKYNPYANRLRDLKIIDELEKDLENWLLYVVSHKVNFICL